MGVWDLDTPPAGIDDEFSRAIVRLMNARFDAIPIERVLVWHLPSVVSDALPHLAAGLGLTGLEFVGGPPRDFISSALELLALRGTPGGLDQALAAIGYTSGVLLEERMARSHDGAIAYSGDPWRYGADFGRSIHFLWVDVPSALTIPQELELWDVANLMRRETARIVLVVRWPGVTHVYRERGDIK